LILRKAFTGSIAGTILDTYNKPWDRARAKALIHHADAAFLSQQKIIAPATGTQSGWEDCQHGRAPHSVARWHGLANAVKDAIGGGQ
jgi:hypothetical protein